MTLPIAPAPGQVLLSEGSDFYQRMNTDLEYLLELDEDHMLQNHYVEAGISTEIYSFHAVDRYGGWEYPACHQRGHFIGHWLSAAARMYTITHNIRLKGKMDYVVSKLAECQKENGGQWVFAIPPKFLDWAVIGKRVWAPHYNIHKTLMGLLDAYDYAGIKEALPILEAAADWFYDYTSKLSQEQLDKMLDAETGGMMESWAQLYAITGKERDLTLTRRYEHRNLTKRILSHPDPLLNRHANTTIPEMQGMCLTYEVTGEEYFLDIAKRYWREAVDERGAYVTGSQNLAEAWASKFDMSGRLGHPTSEHCTGYNMTRLADYLYRATGEKEYQDYIELMLYNSLLAQCFWEGYVTPCGIQTEPHKTTTTVCYYMPLTQGAQKPWGTKTESFWCCHGTAVQACASIQNYIYYNSGNDVILNQYIPSSYKVDGRSIALRRIPITGCDTNPNAWQFGLKAEGGKYAIKLRMPDWLREPATFTLDGQPITPEVVDGYAVFDRDWQGEEIVIYFPLQLQSFKLLGSEDMYAFRNGPMALAALTDTTCRLKGDAHDAAGILHRHAEYEFGGWTSKFTAVNTNDELIEFRPLYDIAFDTYTVYFMI